MSRPCCVAKQGPRRLSLTVWPRCLRATGIKYQWQHVHIKSIAEQLARVASLPNLLQPGCSLLKAPVCAGWWVSRVGPDPTRSETCVLAAFQWQHVHIKSIEEQLARVASLPNLLHPGCQLLKAPTSRSAMRVLAAFLRGSEYIALSLGCRLCPRPAREAVQVLPAAEPQVKLLPVTATPDPPSPAAGA